MTTRNPTWVAEDYRFYADTGAAGSSALAAQNTAITLSDTTKFRLRVAVGETNNANTANVGSWVLQYSVNGGAFATVGAATSVKYTTSDAAAFVDGSTLTTALGGVTGSATYQATWSEQDEGGSVASQTWTDDDTEYEYCMQLNGVSVADTITFRMLSPSSSTAVTFTNVPTLRVPVVQSSTFTGSATFYAGQANHQIPQATSFTSSPTFYGGVVTSDQAITQDSTFTGTATFYGGQVGQDSAITQDSLFTSSPTFYGGTVVNNPQGRHFGPHYFGSRYFGARYWGTIAPETVDGSHFGVRYFGGTYFGKRYWGNNGRVEFFELAATDPIALSGTANVTGSDFLYSAEFIVAQTADIALNSTLVVSGNITYEDEEFNLTPPVDIAQLSGVVTVAGDIEYTTVTLSAVRYFGKRYWGNRYFGKRYWGNTGPAFELVQSAAIPLSGSATLSAAITTVIELAQTNTIGLSGVVAAPGTATFSFVDVVVSRQTPAGRSSKKRRERYIASYKGKKYELGSLQEVEALIARAKAEQADVPKKRRERIKIDLAPEYQEFISPIVDIPERLTEMPPAVVMANLRKIDAIMAAAPAVTKTDDENDEVLLWLI